jgi:hypothetical protein
VALLTTLAAVKLHLGITNANQDALITSYIARESAAVERYTGRTFPAVSATRFLNGTGSSTQVLPEAPILSVTSLTVDGAAVPAALDGVSAGYSFFDTAIYLNGGVKFPYGKRNVQCTWTAGYATTQADTVPAAPHTITPSTGGRAVVDSGVTRTATGAALALVSGTPATGQYAFADGTYTFAAADVGLAVTMAYQYIPGPVEQACIDLVAQDVKTRDNIGIQSKTLAGETVVYASDEFTRGIRQALDMFKRMEPVA